MQVVSSSSEANQFPYKEMGKRIAVAFKDSGLTKVKFAENIGINEATLRTYLNGRTPASVETIKKIAELTGIDENWLSFGGSQGEPNTRSSAKNVPMTSSYSVRNDFKPGDPNSAGEWVRCRADMFAEAWIRIAEATKQLPDNARPANPEILAMAMAAVDGVFE